MRTGNQKRTKDRGTVGIFFDLEPEWDKELCKLAERNERSKGAQLRIIVKDYITRQKIEENT